MHLGHALNNTLQDILIRQKRMQGFETLWMPGTDHAGIATQAVVERRLLDRGEAHAGTTWAARGWSSASGSGRTSTRPASSASSSRWAVAATGSGRASRSTTVCARAVRHTFFSLFKDGMIYRGKRLVNWDTFLQTAVSDDEVFHETVTGHFWHFRYPVIDPKPGEPTHVTIATTRPETMLGDTAVAVHPDPAAALDQAEAELARAAGRRAGEGEAGHPGAARRRAQRRSATMLPQLVKLRDMALRRPQGDAAAAEPRRFRWWPTSGPSPSWAPAA